MAPIAVNTTCIEWSPAERFVSGSARQIASVTRPSVDVQSVPSFTATSNQVNAAIPSVEEKNSNTKVINKTHLTAWEVPVKEEPAGRGTAAEPNAAPARYSKEGMDPRLHGDDGSNAGMTGLNQACQP